MIRYVDPHDDSDFAWDESSERLVRLEDLSLSLPGLSFTRMLLFLVVNFGLLVVLLAQIRILMWILS